MATRRDIIKRGESFSDDGCRYHWKWAWLDEEWQPPSVDSKSKPPPVRYGQWIRKLQELGKSYCVICRVELAYANRGVVVFHKHIKSEAHKQHVRSQSNNTTLPGKNTWLTVILKCWDIVIPFLSLNVFYSEINNYQKCCLDYSGEKSPFM